MMNAMEMQAKPATTPEGLQKGEGIAFDVNGKRLALLAIKKRGLDK